MTVDADERRRHALHEERQHQSCGGIARRQCLIGMGMGVNKPRRDDQTGFVDNLGIDNNMCRGGNRNVVLCLR